MTIASYTELVSEMGDWLNRADLAAKIPTFVRLFEARMNRRLRSPDMEQTFSFTTVSGITSYALSSSVRELRDVFIEDDGTLTNSIRYTVRNGTLQFDNDPGDGTTVQYTAYVTLVGLDSGNASNWLLSEHPDIYLFGSLARAEAYLKDDARLAVWKAAEDEAMAEIVREANQKRMPAGPLVMRPIRSEGYSLRNMSPNGTGSDDPGDLVIFL